MPSTELFRTRKYFIITEIDNVKQYVRRKSITVNGRARVTMTTSNIDKAFDFGSNEKASDFLRKLGIGYAIEVSE